MSAMPRTSRARVVRPGARARGARPHWRRASRARGCAGARDLRRGRAGTICAERGRADADVPGRENAGAPMRWRVARAPAGAPAADSAAGVTQGCPAAPVGKQLGRPRGGLATEPTRQIPYFRCRKGIIFADAGTLPSAVRRWRARRPLVHRRASGLGFEPQVEFPLRVAGRPPLSASASVGGALRQAKPSARRNRRRSPS